MKVSYCLSFVYSGHVKESNRPSRTNIHLLNHISRDIVSCKPHIRIVIYAIYDPFNIKVFLFISNRIHSAYMKLVIFIGLYNLLSFHIPNCVWMNKNSSPESMTKVYLSWRIMFDMVCEPL